MIAGLANVKFQTNALEETTLSAATLGEEAERGIKYCDLLV